MLAYLLLVTAAPVPDSVGEDPCGRFPCQPSVIEPRPATPPAANPRVQYAPAFSPVYVKPGTAGKPVGPIHASCSAGTWNWMGFGGKRTCNDAADASGKASKEADHMLTLDLRSGRLAQSATRVPPGFPKKPLNATLPPPARGRGLEITTNAAGVNTQLFGADSRRKVTCDDSADGPYGTTVQVRMGGSFCSGTLVGPRHVLTAGHCIYAYYHTLTGDELPDSQKGWASSVKSKASKEWGCPWATPINLFGMEASATSLDGDGDRSVSTVDAVALMTYVGWVRDGDSDYDIALVELAKPHTTWKAGRRLTDGPAGPTFAPPVETPVGWSTFGYAVNPSYEWTWCTNGFPGDKSLELHSECRAKGLQDVESLQLDTYLDGASGQSGSALVPAFGDKANPTSPFGAGHNGRFGGMHGDLRAGPVLGVFASLFESSFLGIELTAHNDFARITPDRFLSMCDWLSGTIRPGEFDPCGGA